MITLLIFAAGIVAVAASVLLLAACMVSGDYGQDEVEDA